MQLQPYGIAIVSVYGVVMLVGVIGNSIVIKNFSTGERKKMAGSAMIVVLAVNDLLTSIFFPMYQFLELLYLKNINDGWQFGHVLCVAPSGFGVITWMASSWTLVTISLERYR